MAKEYRTSMKITAGGGDEVSGYSRLPEVFGDEADDARLDLKGACDVEESRRLRQEGGLLGQDNRSTGRPFRPFDAISVTHGETGFRWSTCTMNRRPGRGLMKRFSRRA